MNGFVRVRAVTGPKHEFHAPVDEVAANPEIYDVLDATPVDAPADVLYVEPSPAPQVKKSVGDNQKEER